MRLLAFLSLIPLIAVSVAIPSPRTNYVLHEKRAMEPRGWVKSRRLEGDQILPMRFGLSQNNLHKIEEMLLAVSHPDSAQYGKHYTPAEVVDTFAPSKETISTVVSWLTESGFSPDRLRLTASKGWIEVNATTAEVEDLLDTEYHVYTHPSGVEQLSCHSYSVPEHIRKHIDIIKPTVHFANHIPVDTIQKRSFQRIGMPSTGTGPKTNGVKVTQAPSGDLDDCDEMITPDCLRALYTINYTPVATDKNSYGIVEFTPQAFLAADLDLFFKNFSQSSVGVRPTLVSIDGGKSLWLLSARTIFICVGLGTAQTTDQGFDFNGESDLDLEYAMALTSPQPIVLLQTGDLVEGASFDNWLDAVDGSFCTFEGGDDPFFDGIYPDNQPGGFQGQASCGIVAPPFVVSVSYGQDEAELTAAYAQRQCAEYAKLGLMGTTVLYSSGDNGVAGNGNDCIDANGRISRRGTRFNPGFPVTCGFLTAVGATQINPGSTVNDPEGACEQVIFSGGGFSNFFEMPSYQADSVNGFLTNHPPPFTSAQFNNSGNARGFPDLSANGANYVVAIDGQFVLVFGTSASSPVVGSMITLINDARIAAGKGPVGFINPAIYTGEFADAFHDITIGGNQGCGTPGFTS
ncbi:hypothetical protein NLI96_g3409 [Meripilus lineatus]|uniref:Peptidase S53 domain-containing protein n=1 Tax=Meripilus lineatus TaxID=2056292 RepID=A0AAD5YKW5_9APHY|nr:hypothetical protein NLI96_g3409 [Physisporinus lineatus]